MKRTSLFLIATLFLIVACGENKESAATISANKAKEALENPSGLKAEIESLKSFFASQNGKQLDKVKAVEMIEKSQQFSEVSPDDPIGASYLFTAGEVARAIGQYEEAINIFTKVESNYPKAEKAPHALFMKGFTFEENIKNKDLAKKYYQEFLEKYPEHTLAKEVKQLIEVIDLSPEELIKRFKEQNQQ